MKIIIFVRHAKSSWNDLFCSDFDRGLNARGKRDLRMMSTLLAVHLQKPDLIVSSPSKRTMKTANAFAASWNYKKRDIIWEKSLYEASSKDIIASIERTNETVQSLLIVWHNPGFTELINECGYSLDNLPTCWIVVFEYHGTYRWNFELKQCFLKERYFPKEIEKEI